MNATKIVRQLKDHKGQHIQVCWERTMKTRADFSMFSITKRTCAYVRAGIDYANLSAVKAGIECGERDEVQALPWGEWKDFPFIIQHNGTEYVRLYPATFDNLKPTVEYFCNDAPISAEGAKQYCLASEFREREEKPLCFTIKAESLVRIG